MRGYALNFLDCVERTLGARVDRDEMLIEYGDRTTRVRALPLGIEFERYEELARSAPPSQGSREQLVLGVDRLDYTKGIPERMRAFERLLERYPEHRERVVLLQLAVPSRSQVEEYQSLKRELDEMVGRINGRFATSRWSPIPCAAFLTGIHPRPNKSVGISVDQLAAREFSKYTQLGSLEISLESSDVVGVSDGDYNNYYLKTIAWRSPTTPLPMENHPRKVFERLLAAA